MASVSTSQKNNQKIIFKCDQHSAIISKKLQSFYGEKEFFDTDLVAGHGDNCVVIQAHRVVLCALSEYFFKVFRRGQTNLKANTVELKEVEPSTLQLIVDFMYLGSIALSIETVEEILRTASFLKMNTLIVGCCELIEKNINIINCLQSFQLANELSLPKLKTKALECTYTYFEDISKEKEILMLSENDLMDLLFNDNPHGDIEEDVFLSMVAWINYDKPNREHLVFQLLSMVRYQALSPKFIIENRKSVCKTVESYELICSWLQWHLSPETRSSDQQNYDFKPRKMPEKLAVIKFMNDSKIKIVTFDPKLKLWSTEIETNLSTRRPFCSINVTDGKPIVVGGTENGYYVRKVEYLDIETLKWTDLPEMEHYKSYPQLVDLNGCLGVYGGNSGFSFKSNPSLEIYNFSTNKWIKLIPLSQPSKTSRIAESNGMLYILDFENGLLQSYDVSSKKWTSKIIEIDSVRDFGFSAVNGFLYVIGGCSGGKKLKNVKRYDLSNNSWSEVASLPNASSYIKTTVFQNKIITASPWGIDEYNFETDTWNTLSPLEEDLECDMLYICSLPVKNK